MLEIKNLKKSYQKFTLDCTLRVQSGRIVGLIGQNGAGKSTTFKAILGLISIESGSVTVLGKNVKDFIGKDKENLGVVLSDSGFSGYLTVRDLLPILKNMYKSFDLEFFTAQLVRFGLPLDKQIKDFSTGMQAKLKVLVALSHGAKLVVLDEPTAGLDVVARDEVLLLLREYMEGNDDRAILISSHISSDLETLCDELYIIHEGKIILHEDTDVLLDEYALLKADASQFAVLDKTYLLYTKEEGYGYCCLTNKRQFYVENYPTLAIEKGSIDGVITMMIKGERI